MAKQLVAVTHIKHDGETYEAGSALNPELFTKEQVRNLYDSGAVAIEDVEEATPEVAEEEAEQ